jgi:ACS family tartrate transporter-like MFS transporter
VAVAKARRRLIPFLFILYIAAYLDRINVGFAALQMNEALRFSATTYSAGAGIFFVSYAVFEIPSNVILARVGARLWIARIMISWGIVSSAMLFVTGPVSFYTLRFLLGAAEAGFFPGILFYLTRWFPARERARTIAAFMTAVLIAGVVGSPISGALLSVHSGGLAGWQWLFLLEGLPSIVLGLVVLRALTERPQDATWLTAAERLALVTCLEEDGRATQAESRSVAGAMANRRTWLLAGIYFGLLGPNGAGKTTTVCRRSRRDDVAWHRIERCARADARAARVRRAVRHGWQRCGSDGKSSGKMRA